MNWFIENWDSISTIISIVAAVALPAAVPYIAVLRKTVKEVVEVIDKSPSANKTFQKVALKEGKKAAVKALARLKE